MKAWRGSRCIRGRCCFSRAGTRYIVSRRSGDASRALLRCSHTTPTPRHGVANCCRWLAMAGRSSRPRRASAPTRIENDLLGERSVPADALYGIQTVRAVENLSFSQSLLRNYPDYIRALAMVKKAAARANRDAHVIDAQRLGVIEYACDALIRGEHLDQFPIDMLS